MAPKLQLQIFKKEKLELKRKKILNDQKRKKESKGAMETQSLLPCSVASVINSNRRISNSKAVGVRVRVRVRVRAMRAVVQRVASASVEVDGRIVSEIGPGLLVLVGIHESDSDTDADYICRKVLNMKLFSNENTGKGWDHNVMQRNYQVLLVSQFTLSGFMKSNKPDFHLAMAAHLARPFYASLVDRFRNAYTSDEIKDGVFGALMKVSLVNDGPVTILLDSKSQKNAAGGPNEREFEF